MAKEPKKDKPEIMPPAPDVQPGERPTEVPQDKDLPESPSPARDPNEPPLQDEP